MTTGIDAIDFYVPNLYVDIKDLAELRNIPYEKLNKGLGLSKMAIPDCDEDTASFAANALLKLIEHNDIDPTTIGRVYLGTESALDSSKPTATYAVEVVEKHLESKYGSRSFKNCDVLDMTFACIGGVDAFQNCLEWVQNKPDRKAIVIASDVSKYELNSTGEYTQGGGAVAMLICNNPSLIAISDVWGVATKSEGDFFKPRRSFNKSDIINEFLTSINAEPLSDHKFQELLNSDSSFWSDSNEFVKVYKEEPVFDGQFSNQCYSDRITEAFSHFNTQQPTNFLKDWQHLIFHLPYAYHGRRIIFTNWVEWLKATNTFHLLEDEIGNDFDDVKTWKKAAVKSKLFSDFISHSISAGELASSEIGNMYTASIFMSLLSMLSHHYNTENDIVNQKIGFIAYGSGSKSKVFEGTVQNKWKSKLSNIQLFEYLNNRTQISTDDYANIHTCAIHKAIESNNTVRLKSIETDTNIQGLRRYSL